MKCHVEMLDVENKMLPCSGHVERREECGLLERCTDQVEQTKKPSWS
jgi:hypothetical protein